MIDLSAIVGEQKSESLVRFDLGGYGKGRARTTVNLVPNCDIQCDITEVEKYAPEPASVDEFFLSHTLEHIPIEHYADFIMALRRRLKPGGQIRVVQSDARGAIELFNQGKLSFRAMRTILFTPKDRILQNQYHRHHQMWDAEELRRDFEAIGLEAETFDAGTWRFDTADEFYDDELRACHGVPVANLGVIGTKKEIPKIIHQTYITEDVPQDLFRHEWQQTWKDLAGFEYRFWTDVDNRALIENDYPWFLPTYDTYDVAIKRVDAARYFILHKFGGIYADLDMACLRPLNDLMKGADFLLAYQRENCLANAFMAMAPGHSLMQRAIERLQSCAEKDVLEATGPFFLTKVAQSLPLIAEVLEPEIIYPFPWNDPAISHYREMSLDEIRTVFPKAVTATHWAGSWKRGS